jgi:outer membrane receptor protein involved in Fe transport
MLLRFVSRCKKLPFLLFLLTLSLLSMAQRTVSGKVIASDNKQPLPGATIVVKGSNATTVTDNNGEFSIPAGEKDLLIISNVGYGIREIKATESGSVALTAETRNLDEIVVTALGIKKEKKKLGYAVQEVKGEELLKAREPNAINGLVGKVAGLTVGINAELLSAPNILLRGRGINLYVIDGVPINSDTWNISPDDVESYTVLKGATASAL